MRIVMFYHSLVSDWNHGNAHFLRGIVTELLARNHEVRVLEPSDSWSLHNLRAAHGDDPIARFHQAYPGLASRPYDLAALDLDEELAGADVVLVHEWNAPALVAAIGHHRARAGRYRVFFHDTHHRLLTDPDAMGRYDLAHYDGVLAYGEVLRALYESSGRVARAWTWHEAADTRVFRPMVRHESEGDLVWIGNWGDEERSAELREFFVEPCRALSLKARAHGVRYPAAARRVLEEAGIHYAGWLPNFDAPRTFAGFKVTIHVPRRPYVQRLRGIPTIRPFEALACGIPLVCSPWEDVEGLFAPGLDFLVARNGIEMTHHLRALLHDPDLRREIAAHGWETIRSRHTCAHRVDELMAILAQVRGQNADTRKRPSRTAGIPGPVSLSQPEAIL